MHIEGWLAPEQSSCQPSRVKHRCPSCQGYLPNKIQSFCGKFRRLGRSRSVLLPALASQGPSSRTGPQLSCPPNSTQYPVKEHQLAVTLLRCASLQCTSEGPCKTWPFVHDQPLTRRLQPEPRVACKALLALSAFKGIE